MFKIGDKVKVFYDGEQQFGEIEKVNAKSVRIFLYDEYKTVTSKNEDVILLQDISIPYDEFAEFARFEKTVYDFVGEDGFHRCIINQDDYEITPLDLISVLDKIEKSGISSEEFYWQWFCFFDNELPSSEYDSEEIYSDDDVLWRFASEIYDWVVHNFDIDFNSLKNEIQNYIEDKSKSITKRRYPDYIKNRFLIKYNSDSALNNASEEYALLYKAFAEDLCKKGQKQGLLAVGYGCYGGNRVFECDWKRAEECMLKLIETVKHMPDRAFYANTLGYIYYYGRCNNGIPQYEEAYKYFSFASFNGIYEAQYKTADMYKNGYGVIKSVETSNNIIWKLYEENRKYIANGEFDCKFADIAFRVGNSYRDDEDIEESDFDEMLYYYMQADFAIRMRMKCSDYYGDSKVCSVIQNALAETKKLMDFEAEKKMNYYDLAGIFGDTLSAGIKLELKIKPLKNNRYKMTFKPHSAKMMFLTVPDLEICGMYEKLGVILKTDGVISESLFEKTLLVDKINYNDFMYDNKSVLELNDDYVFEIKAPAKKLDKTYRIASVCFNEGGRLYDYLCENESIKENDIVNVFANGENKSVRVVRILTKKETELSLPVDKYKKI